MTRLFLHIFAESEPFWQQPVVLIIIAVIAISLVLSVFAGIMKFLGLSLLMFLLFPLTSRIGRFLLVGLIIGVGGVSFLHEQFDRFIKPTITSTDALERIEKLLTDDAETSDASGRLPAGVRSLRTTGDSATPQTASVYAHPALETLEGAADQAAEARKAHAAYESAAAAFAVVRWEAKEQPSTESIARLAEQANKARVAARTEHRAVKALSDTVTAALEKAQAASDPSKASLEDLRDCLKTHRESLRKARRRYRRIRKIAVRNRIVDEAPDRTKSSGGDTR